MNDIERMKEILEEMKVLPEVMAGHLGITPRSYQVMTTPSAKVTPKWVTAFLLAWDLANEDLLCIDCNVRTSGFGYDMLFCDKCANKDKDESI